MSKWLRIQALDEGKVTEVVLKEVRCQVTTEMVLVSHQKGHTNSTQLFT